MARAKVAFIIVIFSGTYVAQNSMGFRGPGGQGITDETELPVSWNDSTNIVWKEEMPGYGSHHYSIN